MLSLSIKKNHRRLFVTLAAYTARPHFLFPPIFYILVCFCFRLKRGSEEKDKGTEKKKYREDFGRMVTLVARQGRQLQRYSSAGGRLVVGCIPYKFDPNCSSNDLLHSMEVLVISSQKGFGMMFPKGGWESDETIKQAASREAFEEAGIRGNVERKLGNWKYISSTQAVNEGIMFPLKVTEELIHWPEMSARNRRWVSVAEAREGCKHPWMREALDRLVRRLSSLILRRKSASAA